MSEAEPILSATDDEIAAAVYDIDPNLETVVTADGQEFAPNTNVLHACAALEHAVDGFDPKTWIITEQNGAYQTVVYFQLRPVADVTEDTLAKSVAQAAYNFATHPKEVW